MADPGREAFKIRAQKLFESLGVRKGGLTPPVVPQFQLTFFNALRIAVADCQRCVGSLTSARSMISQTASGRWGACCRSGIVGCSKIALIVSAMLVFRPMF